MLLYEELSSEILKAFYNVYNKLGYGFLEKVYENALLLELRKNRLKCESQIPIKVYYDEVPVGEYFADIMVEDIIILELKAAEKICENHEYQLLNYLKATKIELGFLLNFGKYPEFKRKIYSNQRKLF
ncbi:GxxExxY protein [Gaoshiqia sediminis]|uniref:GxxExxY protein n=1 Tax=Gaoshiqia sediminis TaxID=2986998 RepID=A0AA42C9T2_9BACT|nr:GxxExxY protein [Gaoshiqia sediminis]MCW0482867.1 GxxExxY protein [Gaoshiqia sediminis]